MKILISDYTSNYSSEPMYLNTIFNTIGCSSTLWSNNISTFDMFDLTKPDLHITHHSLLTKDLAIYLQNANVDLVINITGMKQEHLNKLEAVLSEYNIVPKFFFINYHQHDLKSKTNIVTVLHGVDLFLGQSPPQYNIDYAIFVNHQSQITKFHQTYHYVTNYENLANEADIFLPITRLNHLYCNYNHIVIKYFDNVFPQVFFDAAFYNGNVFFDIENRTNLDNQLAKLLQIDNKCNIADLDSGNIRDLIMKKHTCLHRAKSLLSQLSCKNLVDNLQEIIEGSIS